MKKMNPRITTYFRTKDFEKTFIGSEIDHYEA